MPTFEREDASIYYEEYGSGYPLLLFAPGGMRSAIDFWHNAPFDPTVALADNFHPAPISQEIRSLVPSAAYLEDWKEPEAVAETVRRVQGFLESHTPARV